MLFPKSLSRVFRLSAMIGHRAMRSDRSAKAAPCQATNGEADGVLVERCEMFAPVSDSERGWEGVRRRTLPIPAAAAAAAPL